MSKAVFLLVLLTASCCWAQFPAKITIEEALPWRPGPNPYPNTSSVNRTSYPVTFSFPLKQGDAPGPAPEKHMGLLGASAGQFRCLGFWSDHSCMWMLVDTEVPSFRGGPSTAPARYTRLQVTVSGSGNFGSSQPLATNGKTCDGQTDSGFICVDTGVAKFTIRKSNYDLFHKVQVGARTLVNGSSEGLVIRGPDLNSPMPPPPRFPGTCEGGNCPVGASFGARTYHVAISCVAANGETVSTPASAPINLPAGHLLRISAPESLCASPSLGYMVYAALRGDPVRLQTITPLALGKDWTEPASCPFKGGTAQVCNPNTGLLRSSRGPVRWAGHGDGCGTVASCNVLYKSSLDASSTAVVEENGPVKAVIRASGSFASTATSCPERDASNSNCDLHYTVRMYFYRQQKFVRLVAILRNADNAPGDGKTHKESDYKGFSGYEMRVVPTLGPGKKKYAFGTSSGAAAGDLDGRDDAYLYQAYSNHMEYGDFNQPYHAGPDAGANGPVPEIFWYNDNSKTANNNRTYVQEGYLVKANGGIVRKGTRAEFPEGWADLSDASGAGIEIGVWYMSGYWPKALMFKRAGQDAYNPVIGLLPDPELFSDANILPYYQTWPAYRIYDTFWNFHDAPLASPGNEFAKFQYNLIGRASVADYNRAGVFPAAEPLIEPAAMDSWLRSKGIGCCLTDLMPRAFRWVGFGSGGEGNQHEFAWSYLRNWLERGLTGRYLFSLMFYRWYEENAWPRADWPGGWRDNAPGHGANTLSVMGMPQIPNTAGSGSPGFAVGNGNLATRNWNGDDEHPHFWGIGDMYFVDGDETLKDFLLQGWLDYGANPRIRKVADFPRTLYAANRAVSGRILHSAYLYSFLQAVNRPQDAETALEIATTVLHNQVPPTLRVSGYGAGTKPPPDSFGISPVRGINWSGSSNADDDLDDAGRPSTVVEIGRKAGSNLVSVTAASGVDKLIANNPKVKAAREWIYVSGTGDRTLDGLHQLSTWTDQKHFSFETQSTAPASFNAGMVRKAGLCPPPFGNCGPAYVNQTWRASLPQSLYEIAAAAGTNWHTPGCSAPCLYYQSLDDSYASGMWAVTEGWQAAPGRGSPPFERVYLNWYNGDKFFYFNPDCHMNSWYWNWAAVGAYQGKLGNLLPQVENYLKCRGRTDEYGSYMMDALLNLVLNPPQHILVDVPVKVENCSASSCILRWTVPAGAVSYRMKARSDGKQIVDWLDFDNLTDPGPDGSGCAARHEYVGTKGDRSGCFRKDPATNWPWFSSPDLNNVPAPSRPGTEQSCQAGRNTSTCTFAGFNAAAPAQNRFAIKAVLAGGSERDNKRAAGKQ